MRIAVAMSGGVDSSTVFRMLHDEGHEVFGITMRHLPKELSPERIGSCCSPGSVASAARLAASLESAHYTFDLEERFAEDVMKRTAEGLADGRTPNPCIICNERVKFGALFSRAMALGAEMLATGHYARLENGRLFRGADRAKDQAYFLYRISREAREKSLFPLGGLTKKEVRDRARSYGLEMHAKPDSVDVCFAPRGDFSEALSRFAPSAARPGPFVTDDGSVVGEHRGVGFYTIGQRRGVGVSAAHRLYVDRIDPGANTVRLGSRPDSSVVSGKEACFHAEMPGAFEATARIRSQHGGVPVTVRREGENRIEVGFQKPEFGVTPGQSVVLYDEDLVLGGAIIA